MPSAPLTRRPSPQAQAAKHRITKDCRGCGRRLPLDQFGKYRQATDGLQYRCKACVNEYQREYMAKARANRVRLSGPAYVPPAQDAPTQLNELEAQAMQRFFPFLAPPSGAPEFLPSGTVRKRLEREQHEQAAKDQDTDE